MNNHCDFVSIEKAYDLMEKLGIKSKSEFARLCGCKAAQQFYNWERKGRMPEFRLTKLQQSIAFSAKKKYDDVLRILYE
jgi:hypothetical protein